MTAAARQPTIVVAGTASGVGKTSVATGLMGALRRVGHVVQGAKIGPDYIDPGYHALATGRPARNLDVVLSGADLIAPLARHAAAGAHVTVVEGVMGLYDGASPVEGTASTAHVAALLGAPVILVVDVSAMARSVAALVHGFATFDPDVRIAGVIANRLGSARHADLVRQALSPLGIPLLGVLHTTPDLATPSRHLGLVPVDERRTDAARTVDALAGWVAGGVDLGAVMAIAREARVPAVPAWDPQAAVAGAGARPSRGTARPVVAVAGGQAFSFRYAENVELLAAAGAEVIPFDPLVDPSLPQATAAVYLGGGFPEVHATDLAANTPLVGAVRDHAAAARPVVAECGGLLYLCRRLEDTDGAGVVDAEARMAERLALGYRRATAAADSVLWRAGEVVGAHEFHRTTTTPAAGANPAWRIDDRTEGFVTDHVHASYLHTHWAASPQAAVRLVAAARRAVAG